MKTNINVAATLISESRSRPISDACLRLGYQLSNYSSEEELLSSTEQSASEVIVMELDADSSRPLSLQQQLCTSLDPASVVFLAARPSVEAIVKSMQSGAVTVLSPNSRMETILETIELAVKLQAARGVWIEESQDARLRIRKLSTRQHEIMQAILDGQSNKGIAYQMKISAKTVEKQRNEIRQRTGTTSLAELERLKATADRPLNAAYSLSLDSMMLLQRRSNLQLI